MKNPIINGKFFATKEIKKSKQEYTCCYCLEPIEKGTSYIDHTVQDKEGLKHYKAHCSCNNCVKNLNTYIKESSYINYLDSLSDKNEFIFSKFTFVIYKFFQEFMCKDCVIYNDCKAKSDVSTGKCLHFGLWGKILEIDRTFKYKELVTTSTGKMKLINRVPTIKCTCCGKPIKAINTNFFANDGSDFKSLVPFQEITDVYTKISVPTFWCGSDLDMDDHRDLICCPHCGKFPFPDAEIQTYNIIEVVCFNKAVTNNEGDK